MSSNIFDFYIGLPIELTIHSYCDTVFSGIFKLYTADRSSHSFFIASDLVTIPNCIPFSIRLPTREESEEKIRQRQLHFM